MVTHSERSELPPRKCLDAPQVARQILIARRHACPGFVLFSLGATTRDEILPALRAGLLAP